MSTPAVSVVLPVFNGARYVKAAIDSILSQTFDDFELIIIDDGSSDATAAIVREIKDPRLQFVQQTNQGLSATLNKGIHLARGKFIARQDHDDISLPERLHQQVAFLSTHAEYALLGTRSKIVNEVDLLTGGHEHPLLDYELRVNLLFDNYFVHSSVMLRRDAVLSAGLYATEPAKDFPEDYDLWSKIARSHKIANLGRALVVYREVGSSISRRSSFGLNLMRLSADNLSWATGMPSNDSSLHNLAALWHRQYALIEGNPNRSEMSKIIRLAAKNLGKDKTEDEREAVVGPLIRKLDRQILLSRFDRLPSWMAHGLKSARSILQKRKI